MDPNASRPGPTAPDAARDPVMLAALTTIGLGGPAPAIHTASSTAELADRAAALDDAGGALVIGGGSNLVIADAGVPTPVLHVTIPGLRIDPAGDDRAVATIGAGEDWAAVVTQLVDEGWCGVESLAGIPGSAGATPVQNVGAYGTEISDVLVDVEVYDRVNRRVRTMTPAELRLGYRSSVLRGTDRAIVTAVRVRLTRAERPVRYAELARTLGVSVGETAPPRAVHDAVTELRRGKGMVIDESDPDTRSVGSFFTNPILGPGELAMTQDAIAARLGPDTPVPQYPAGPTRPDGTKLSAAWLIERAGFPRGYPSQQRSGARVTVSTKHTLALTNRGGGTTAELLALAREIRDGVRDAFAVTLRPEPVLVGIEL